MNTAPIFSSASTEWETPQQLYESLHRIFNFTLDVCSTDSNTKCAAWYTKEQNGLTKSWAGERCWMNPPYGREISAWVKKACEESKSALIVGLLPSRTDTAWWHTYVAPCATVRFIKGRLKFGGCKNSAPFPSAVVLWWR